MIRLLLLALFSAAIPFNAYAAVTFALRGDSLTPRYAKGGKLRANYLAAVNFGTPAAVVTAASISATGTKGSSLIDVHLTNGDERAVKYLTGANWVTGTNVFAIRISFVPNWTGNPATDKSLFFIGNDANNFNGGVKIGLLDNGKLQVSMKTGDGVGTNIVNASTTGTLSFTSKTKTEIMLSCDGTTLRASQDGVEVGTWALGVTDRYMNSVIASSMIIGPYSVDTWIDELVIWDTAENHVYTPSSSYLTVDDFDGTSSTDPGAANVLSTAGAYIIAGVTKTPTYVAPSVGNVKTGVTFGAASALTGTYDGSDLWTDPGEAAVEIGTSYTAGGAPKTGTYTGANRWTDILEAKVEYGYEYKANSLTNNKTGSLNPTVNSTTQALVGAANARPIVLTQGDTVALSLALKNGDGTAFDLTGATFETKAKSGEAQVTFANSKHAIVSASAGTFTLSLNATDTASIGLGAVKDLQVKVTQGSNIKFFHGYGVLTVLPAVAER